MEGLARRLVVGLSLLVCTFPLSGRAATLIRSLAESGNHGGRIAVYTGETYTNPDLGGQLVGLFGEDVVAHSDRQYEWNGVTAAAPLPSYLLGGEYIETAVDNRDQSPYSLTITVSQPVFVYLLIDNRGSPHDGDRSDPPDLGVGLNGFGAPFMQWVLDEGFLPIETGTNRTADLSVPDEVGLDANSVQAVGPGNSIDGVSSVYGRRFEAGTFVLHEYGAAFNTGRDMYGVVVTAVPEPGAAALLTLGAVFAGCRSRRRKLF